ncbi:MAG TPA: Glu/Leu/Phe/Val dehydrogenase dimerization domain-containing protein [Bacteriovoracaceae bacterium]|nr:Glu/Leu/Phe/Val dehydrogenase dimerization domain-containing protein [Bacteriovoracaceae bacterium]
MLTLEKMYSMGHEEVVFVQDKNCGLKAIIGIHDTTLGPALGGTRLWPYASEEEALVDVLRLSRGMTYKNAISGLHLGGGKAVIIADPKDKSEALFRAFGRFVESLNGRYITAEDVNTTVQDIEHIRRETKFVTGVAQENGGSGDPSPYTALGVFRGIEASITKVFGKRELKNKTVAIQGVGAVGFELAKLLAQAEANIIYTDVNERNIERVKTNLPLAKFVSPNEIFSVECDVYSPCALGASINDETIPQLKAKIVCGSANNQLKEDHHGLVLKEKGILYAPDYLVNAGGVMNVSIEFDGWNDSKSRRMVNTIYEKTLEVFQIADEQNLPVNKAADVMAENRIKAMKQIRTNYLGFNK